MTAIILAGGKSSRMGYDKAFLKIKDEAFIECQIKLLRVIFDNILISANSPSRYKHLNMPIIEDIYPDKGPLGGIYTGLINSKSFYTFILACDMPFVKIDLIRYLAGFIGGGAKTGIQGIEGRGEMEGMKDDGIENYDVIVPTIGNCLEPLHAFYSRHCITPIKRSLDQNDLKITSFFPRVNVKKIAMDDLNLPDNISRVSLINVNTMEEYESIKGMIPL